MLDILIFVAVLSIGFGLGGIAIAWFLYVVEKLQSGGRDE